MFAPVLQSRNVRAWSNTSRLFEKVVGQVLTGERFRSDGNTTTTLLLSLESIAANLLKIALHRAEWILLNMIPDSEGNIACDQFLVNKNWSGLILIGY